LVANAMAKTHTVTLGTLRVTHILANDAASFMCVVL